MSQFDTKMARIILSFFIFVSHSNSYGGIPFNSETSKPDFAFFAEAPPPELVESLSETNNPDLILEIEGLASVEKINQLTKSNAGTKLWEALKSKTANAKEILKSYPNILNYLKSKAPPAIRKVLTKFKVREKYQSLLVGNVENLLDSAPEILLQANAEGFGARISLIGVVGIGDMLTEKINEFKWIQKLKQLGQNSPIRFPLIKFFGLGLGAGVVFLKFEANNKKYAILRFYANGEYPKRIINFALDGYLGLPVQLKVAEKIRVDEVLQKKIWMEHTKFERSHLSFAGGVTSESEKGRFQHELYIINTPSPGGAISFYEMKVQQLQLNWVFNIDWITKISEKLRSLRGRCKNSVSRP
jgi:hypothetical protein